LDVRRPGGWTYTFPSRSHGDIVLRLELRTLSDLGLRLVACLPPAGARRLRYRITLRLAPADFVIDLSAPAVAPAAVVPAAVAPAAVAPAAVAPAAVEGQGQGEAQVSGEDSRFPSFIVRNSLWCCRLGSSMGR
jgi:hypothetical protein